MGQDASTTKHKFRPSESQKMKNILTTEPDVAQTERSTHKSSMREDTGFLKLSNTRELNKAVEFMSSYLLLGSSSQENVTTLNSTPLLAIEANTVNDDALGCQKELRKVVTSTQITSLLSDELFKQQANNAYKRFSFADQKAQLNLQISRPSGRLSKNVPESENDLRTSRMLKKMEESAVQSGSPEKGAKLRQELEKLENTIRKSRTFSQFVSRNNQPTGDKTLEEQDNLSGSFVTRERSRANSFVIEDDRPHDPIQQQLQLQLQQQQQQQQQKYQHQQLKQQNLKESNLSNEEKFAWETNYNTPPKKTAYREIETQTDQYEAPYYSNLNTSSSKYMNQFEYDSRKYNNDKVTTSKFFDQPNQETKPNDTQDQDESYLSAREKRNNNVKPGHKKTYTITAKKSPSPAPKHKNPYPNIKSRYLETQSKEGAYGKDEKSPNRQKAVPSSAKPAPSHTRDKSTSKNQKIVDKDDIPVVYANLQEGRSRSKTPSKVYNANQIENVQTSNFNSTTHLRQNPGYQSSSPRYQNVSNHYQYQSNYNNQPTDDSIEYQGRNNAHRSRQHNNEKSYRENEFSPINTELNLDDIMAQAGPHAYKNQPKNYYNQNHQNYARNYEQRQHSPNQGYYAQGNYRSEYNQPEQSYHQAPNQSQSQSQYQNQPPRQNKWKVVNASQNYAQSQKYNSEATDPYVDEEELSQEPNHGYYQAYNQPNYGSNSQRNAREQDRRELRHYNAYNNSSYQNY